VNIVIQGNRVRTQTISGRDYSRGIQNMNQAFPNREAAVSVRKLDGRGTALVIQQSSRVNNYTTIIQVRDNRRGSDNYRLEISWRAANALNAYSSGKLRWKGRVDGTVNIRISGRKVESINFTGQPATNVTFNLEGYLARRPGTVSVRRLDGRGTVMILEQPTRQNNYLATIRVFDPGRGADNYELEVTW
jgi:hypothetical protein